MALPNLSLLVIGNVGLDVVDSIFEAFLAQGHATGVGTKRNDGSGAKKVKFA
jgi:hypothetical protein